MCCYELDGHVATITYNRPDKLNAINGEMRAGPQRGLLPLPGRGRRLDCDRDRARAERFVPAPTCATAASSAGDFPGTFWEKPTQNSFESGWEIFKPVIAAVNGPCIGYGLTLVTWCDFVIASERAEFGFPEARIGVPTIVGAIRLPQRINWQYAMELLLTGERIDATRGERDRSRGLGGGRRRPHAGRARPRAIGCSPGAPLAQRAIKEMAVRSQQLPMLEAIRFGETMRKVAAATDDAREGMRAAAERRTPEWQAPLALAGEHSSPPASSGERGAERERERTGLAGAARAGRPTPASGTAATPNAIVSDQSM